MLPGRTQRAGVRRSSPDELVNNNRPSSTRSRVRNFEGASLSSVSPLYLHFANSTMGRKGGGSRRSSTTTHSHAAHKSSAPAPAAAPKAAPAAAPAAGAPQQPVVVNQGPGFLSQVASTVRESLRLAPTPCSFDVIQCHSILRLFPVSSVAVSFRLLLYRRIIPLR